MLEVHVVEGIAEVARLTVGRWVAVFVVLTLTALGTGLTAITTVATILTGLTTVATITTIAAL